MAGMSERRPNFSLLDLLITMSLVAAALGITVYLVKVAPRPIDPEFQDIVDAVRKSPSFVAHGKPKEIRLEALGKFDGEPIEPRVMSANEWNELRKILQRGIEVKNVRLLSLSAMLGFYDEYGSTLDYIAFFWTSESGDVYFQNGGSWFRVSDRKAVRNVLRTNLK
jgi:hypothetical protein